MYISPFKNYLSARHEAQATAQQVERLSTQNRALKEQRAKLDSDAYIEQIARKELGLVRPGEQPYVIKNVDELRAQLENSAPPPAPSSFWQRFKGALGRH